MKYRKKPVVIEAIQWTGENEAAIMYFVGKQLRFHRTPHEIELTHDNVPLPKIFIPTLEGEIFEKTYEPHDNTPDESAEGEEGKTYVKALVTSAWYKEGDIIEVDPVKSGYYYHPTKDVNLYIHQKDCELISLQSKPESAVTEGEKSNKRQFIEKYCRHERGYIWSLEKWDDAEKELMEAIEKDQSRLPVKQVEPAGEWPTEKDIKDSLVNPISHDPREQSMYELGVEEGIAWVKSWVNNTLEKDKYFPKSPNTSNHDNVPEGEDKLPPIGSEHRPYIHSGGEVKPEQKTDQKEVVQAYNQSLILQQREEYRKLFEENKALKSQLADKGQGWTDDNMKDAFQTGWNESYKYHREKYSTYIPIPFDRWLPEYKSSLLKTDTI